MAKGKASNEKAKQDIDAERKAVRELMSTVDAALSAVDASDFCKEHSQKRDYPLFDASEIATGPLLGYGTYGVVWEVEDFLLQDKQNEETAKTDQEAADLDDIVHAEALAAAIGETKNITNGADRDVEEHGHYHVGTARAFMKANVLRNGTDARYAIKVLREDLSDLRRTRGMIDMVVETKLLSRIWHPNIGTVFRELV